MVSDEKTTSQHKTKPKIRTSQPGLRYATKLFAVPDRRLLPLSAFDLRFPAHNTTPNDANHLPLLILVESLVNVHDWPLSKRGNLF